MGKFDINKALGNDKDDNTEVRIIHCSNKEEALEQLKKVLGEGRINNIDIDSKKYKESLEKEFHKRAKNKSDAKIFEEICNTFINVVNFSNRTPAAGMCTLLDNEGNLCAYFCNLGTKEDKKAFLKAIIKELDK